MRGNTQDSVEVVLQSATFWSLAGLLAWLTTSSKLGPHCKTFFLDFYSVMGIPSGYWSLYFWKIFSLIINWLIYLSAYPHVCLFFLILLTVCFPLWCITLDKLSCLVLLLTLGDLGNVGQAVEMWNRWRKTGPRMKDSVWSSVAVLMCLTESSKWSWLRWQFLTCAVSTGRSPWGRLRLLTCPQAKPWHDVDVRVKSFSNEHGGASFHRLLVMCECGWSGEEFCGKGPLWNI